MNRRTPVYINKKRKYLSKPVSNSYIPNIFNNKRRKIAKGHVSCSTVERTAIYKDVNGNKIILKENETLMDAPKDFRGIIYQTDRKRLGKK